VPDPMNVVYLVTDQHRWDILGCSGHPMVQTPNIDALAAEGTRFTNAFTPSAICTPARASLFTGLFPTAHGMTANVSPQEDLAGWQRGADFPEGVRTLGDMLRGVELFYFGKWHIGSGVPSAYGFRGHDFPGYGFPGAGLYRDFAFDLSPGERNRYAQWLAEKGFEVPAVREAMHGQNPRMRRQELKALLTGPPEASVPHFLVDDAVRMLRADRGAGKPFFAWLNFWGPHSPCLVPEPYYSMYRPEDIPVDPAFAEGFEGKPTYFRMVSQMWGLDELEWSGWQEIIARYYGYVTLIDHCIGRFLDGLRGLGLYENTLIVFTSDHGDCLGAHRLFEKGAFMYDAIYRIPLVARHPAPARRGATCDEFVYFHDLCPTAVEAATGRAPDFGFQSQSILAQMRGEKAPTGRDHVFGEFTKHFCPFPQRMVRTRTHKFIFNAAAEGELYDLERDPHELHNVNRDPAYAQVKRELMAVLEREMQARDDPLLRWYGSMDWRKY